MPPVPSKNFLTSKMGPFPIWGWGAGTLAGAYAYSRYKANKAAKSSTSQTSTTAYVPGSGAVGEPATGAPTYLIENNLPPTYTPPSTPVPPPTPAPPVTTPTGTTPSPPTTNTPAPPPPRPPVINPGLPVTRPTPPPPAPAPAPPKVAAYTYRVQHGDTLSAIAARNHIPGGWQALWAYQLDPKNNPPQQIATLKARGPNLLFAGETIRIPAHN